MSSCCRRNPGAYGAEDYTREQVESMYANGLIGEDRYRELLRSPLAAQRSGGQKPSNWMAVGGLAALGLAAAAYLSKDKD